MNIDLTHYVHDHEQREKLAAALEQMLIIAQRSQDVQLQDSVSQLLEWTPENRHVLKKDNDYYSDGDEDCPFFSEAYLYNLLGKEDARTLLALMRPVWAAAGVPRDGQP